MSVRIRISVKGVENIVRKLGLLNNKSWMSIFLTTVSLVLIGNENSGLKQYAPYKYVSRKKAYGVSFFSDKQRRWFFANMPSIPYQRTGEQGKAWRLEGIQGNNATIANRKKSSEFTRGQTNLHRIMGWMTAIQQVRKDLPAAMKKGVAALLRFIGF
jgi:hypothetical protein